MDDRGVSSLIQGRLIPLYVTLHRKKLVVQVRDIIAGKIKLSRSCLFG